MKALLAKLTNLQIKEEMFKMASMKLSTEKQTVYGWMFDELEARLSDDDFDYFLDQLDAQISKAS